MMPHPTGVERLAIVIENDYKDEVIEGIKPRNIDAMTNEEIVDAVKELA